MLTRRKIHALLAGLLAATVLAALPMASSARASTSGGATVNPAETGDGSPTLLSVGPGTVKAMSSSRTSADAACVSTMKADGAASRNIAGACVHTITSRVGPVTLPTPTDRSAMGESAAASDRASATAAVARRCRTWSQTDTTASWQEKQVGRFCYDGNDAYVTSWGGYHRCGQGWTLGWNKTVLHCAVNRINWPAAQGGYFRQNWDYYKVCLISTHVPVCFSYDMHTNVFPSGAVVHHG